MGGEARGMPLLYTNDGKVSGGEAPKGDGVLTDGQIGAPTRGRAVL